MFVQNISVGAKLRKSDPVRRFCQPNWFIGVSKAYQFATSMIRISLSICFLLLIGLRSYAQSSNGEAEIPKKQYHTQRILQEPPVLDGKLDDPAWEQVEWGDGFIQRSPVDKGKATQNTAFKILYDDKNLYIAYRCYDSSPDSIVKRMSRRDGFEGDWVEINIDSYRDLRTAFSFTATVAGVKGDEFISNNGNNWDTNWNPIWFLKTRVDALGWVAEVRIPFSQIRFSDEKEQVWGIQFTRRDFRQESRSVWQYIPNQAPYWVSGFGELHGLKDIKPQRLVELQPYVSGQLETFPKILGNPFFEKGNAQRASAGIDGKIGVTNDLVLDFTINPDFGQVEADPSQVRLDGFEIFFQERRPFFIENNNLFNYQVTNAQTGNFNSDNLFYSRRIGGPPSSNPRLRGGEYGDVPQNTTILGAAKFSGKTQKGLAIGILESLTQQEYAQIEGLDGKRKETVEPLTNYFVGRVTQDFDGGNTVVGGILTSTQRRLNGTGLADMLNQQALTGGADVLHKWDNQNWEVGGRVVLSQVAGTKSSIYRTQTNFVHSFLRPGVDHLGVDTSATSLTGHGGSMHVAKYGGKWRFQTGLTWRSPKLELNDVGFMQNTDMVSHFFWGGLNIQQPFSVFRNARWNYNQTLGWDFGGNALNRNVSTNVHGMFKNFWSAGGGVFKELLDISTRALFGGPALRRPIGTGFFTYINSDRRKAVNVNLNVNYYNSQRNFVKSRGYSLSVNFQPTNAINFSLSPSFNRFAREYQHITTFQTDQGGTYIGGAIDQKTYSLTARANINITPNLTIQYYGQPFITQGIYSDFKIITNPLAFYEDRHELLGDRLIYAPESSSFLLDENRDGSIDCASCHFRKPDFNFIQFRSNLVLRWEYIPGSEFYLVWTQANTQFGDPETAFLPSFRQYLVGEQGRNIFLLKWTYRFLR
ncbi:MAG: DUF5916 domain-containing protein [Bacteroidota bacterium]